MKPLPPDFARKIEILAMEAECALANAQPLPRLDWIRSLRVPLGMERAEDIGA